MRSPRFLPLFAAISLPMGILQAHPVPDIPVRSHFHADGAAEIRVEVDPRSFEENPEEHDYLTKAAVDAIPTGPFEALGRKANAFVASRLKFHFDPLGEVKPEFSWSFVKLTDAGALEKPRIRPCWSDPGRRPCPRGSPDTGSSR